MASPESKPGFFEDLNYKLRNAEVVATGILAFLGHYGAAALTAVGALIDHVTGEWFKNRRVKKLSQAE